jgi:hypothetical protein
MYAIDKYPRLLYATNYDNIFPGMGMIPYESQIDILNFVKDNFKKPFCCIYNALMGAGKTLSVTAIAILVKILNSNEKQKEYQKDPKHQKTKKEIRDNSKTVVYVCLDVLEAVRNTVACSSYKMDVGFGIIVKKDQIIEIVENYKIKKTEKKPQILICGIEELIILLQGPIYGRPKTYKDKSDKNREKSVTHLYKPENFILVFDENLIGMDQPGNQMIEYLARILYKLPPQVIFISATHPGIDELPSLHQYIQTKYHNCVFGEINKAKIKIGTQLNL